MEKRVFHIEFPKKVLKLQYQIKVNNLLLSELSEENDSNGKHLTASSKAALNMLKLEN